MVKIYIYDDYGVSDFCVLQLVKCMKSIYSTNKDLEVRQVKAVEIRDGILSANKPDVLCMGGGFDLGYLKALSKDGCENIRQYVENGGYYLGICAGAYFASSYIEFNLNGPLEVKGERELKFFKGKCIGPLNKNFKYNSDDEAMAIGLLLGDDRHNYGEIYYYLNGGCSFIGGLDSNVTIVATYKMSNEVAIIKCNYGNGGCLLSGVHFEFDADDLNMNNVNIRDNVYNKLFEKGHNKYFLLKNSLSLKSLVNEKY